MLRSQIINQQMQESAKQNVKLTVYSNENIPDQNVKKWNYKLF